MKIFKITENDSNQRLDRFLKKLLKNSSMSFIYKLNRTKKVKINSKKQDISYKLQIWDEVKIFLINEEFKELSNNKKNKVLDNNIKKKLNKKDIIYEDNYLLVINKKPHINVHPWNHKTKEISIIEQVRDYLWENYNSLTFSPSLVHRIDRDTSWILLIAKQKDILSKLVRDFKEHQKIQKTYIAYVFWKPSRKNWTIKKNLLRIENAKNENKVQISEKWQTAITHYKLLSTHNLKTKLWEEQISKLEVVIETWRMHQIRVHLASIWCPIIWDNKYWNKKLNSYISNNFWLKRQALHAFKLSFFHYGIKKQMELIWEEKWDTKNLIFGK